MAHMFDILSNITGQINLLTDYYYFRKIKTIRKLPEIPDFIYTVINRYLLKNNNIICSTDKQINVELCIVTDAGDAFSPVYIAVVNNISLPILDKIVVQVDHKDDYGLGNGIILCIPKITFADEADVDSLIPILKGIYFGILEFDSNMTYKPSDGMLRVANNPNININSYDLEMIYTAICCMNIIMRKWYNANKDIKVEDLTMYAFCDSNILLDDDKNKIKTIISKFGTTIGDLRDALVNGKLLKAIIE